jgi:hypothetical protein
MPRLVTSRLLLGCCLSGVPALLAAQGAIDPRMPVRAAELVRQGERSVATDMLGRYLAVAPDDGHAWLQLGRLYLIEIREWHARHQGEPDGALLLDFAQAAFDQAQRLVPDSSLVLHTEVDIDRALVVFETLGWATARTQWQRTSRAQLPPELAELGQNLLRSCPVGGVLVTGGDVEAVAVWQAALSSRDRGDVVPLRPDLYVSDAVYRRRMALLLQVDPALSLRNALTDAASRRPICISPAADAAVVPDMQWHASRLVRVNRGDVPAGDALAFTALLEASEGDASAWVAEVRAVYDGASRHNVLLCPVLQPVFGDTPPVACRP